MWLYGIISPMLSATSPFSFILFGASGHLARQKIYPSLYVLALKKRLPKDYAVVGFARTEMDDEAFRTLVKESIEAAFEEVTKKALEEFLGHIFYHQGQYDKEVAFAALAKRLKDLEKGGSETVRIAYLSIPPTVFSPVLHNICAGGLPEGREFHCIVEKPVGHDLKSFEAIKGDLIKCLREEQIYLLDHYLGKEAVRNVYYLRYANPVLERLFKNSLIHHVEITALESDGIEGRAGYFESTGTFRDMFQSHLLEICSLLTMRFGDEDILAGGRLEALSQFYLPPAGSLDDVVLQGQYSSGTIAKNAAPGYRSEEGIEKNSRTNTFAALKLLTRTPRWQGVPFYLRSGKRLAKKETRISIQFQAPVAIGKGSNPNRLDIILQGEAGMRLHLQTKLGGSEPSFRPLLLEDPLVCVGDCLPEHGLLLLEAIRGKKDWFLTFDEVRTAWRLIDPLQAHLEKESTPLYEYAAGSLGPEEADEWIKKDGMEWFNA